MHPSTTASGNSPDIPTPYTFQDFTQPPRHTNPPPPPVTASSATLRPERCCVYCGHALYAPPRTPRTRCPKCFQELPVKDILLAGEVTEKQIVTAGKITVQPGARVQADLIAAAVEISGMVLGNVLASHTCRINPTGKLAGQLLCRHLDLHPGAALEGTFELVK